MSSKPASVFAIYDTRPQAKVAVDALVAAGVASADISPLFQLGASRGGVLLSVHCEASDEIDTAKHVFRQTGGESFAG